MEKNQYIYILQTIFTLPIQFAIEYYFYKNFLGYKRNKWLFILYSIIITTFIFSPLSKTKIMLNIVHIVIAFIFVFFMCRGNIGVKFYSVILIETISLLISLMFIPLDNWLFPMGYNLYPPWNNTVILIIVDIARTIIHSGLVYILLKIFLKYINIRDIRIDVFSTLYLLTPCFASYVFSLIFYYILVLPINNTEYYLFDIFPIISYFLPMACLGLLISIFICAYTFKKMIEKEQEKQLRILMEQQFKLQIEHSKNIEAIYNGIRSVKHDMHNHISCLKNLADNNKINEMHTYLENISQTISELDFEIKTGNYIADAIINEKYNIAKAEGIEFKCDFMMPKQTILEPIDICIILGNALDNSIEACRKIQDDNIAKTISIKSFIRELYLIIEFTNTCEESYMYLSDKNMTSKSDFQNHGMGIPNIKAAVKKYNGTFDIVQKNNTFILNIMIKIK